MIKRPVCSIALVALLLTGRPTAGFDLFKLEVQFWQPPRTGWLYVVDATRDAPFVLLFDPEHGEIAGAVRTGYSPDIAVSPQGDRLYIASTIDECGQPNCDQLAALDTQSGRVVSLTAIPGRTQSHFPTPSTMIVSPDGRTVYVPVWQGLYPGGDTPMALAAFDTARAQFLDGVIDLGVCGFASFVPVNETQRLAVHCAASNELLVYRLIAPDRGFVDFSIRLPWGHRLFARHVYDDVPSRNVMMSADPARLFVAGGDGAISVVNLALGSVAETPVLGNQVETVVPFRSPPTTDRGRLYEGVGPYNGEGVAREIRVFDTNTWMRVGTIRTSTPFVTAVTAREGSTIYALTGNRGTILVIDADSQRELRAMAVGHTPSIAIVAP